MKHGRCKVWSVSPSSLRRTVLVGLLALSCVVFGCVPAKVQVQSARQFNPSEISSIAVVPFQAFQSTQWGYGQAERGVRDPEEIMTQFRLPGADQTPRLPSQHHRHTVSETAAGYITTQVESVLRGRSGLRLIESRKVAASANLSDEQSDTSLRAVAQEIGEHWNVDAVLMGLVRTYREREGSRMGAKPAAVGFEIFLVAPSDGKILWKGEFFEEQKPLTQDIVGFFEKSGGFVTAREISELGVKKVMESFPVGITTSSTR